MARVLIIRCRIEDGVDILGEFVRRDIWVCDIEGVRGVATGEVSDFWGGVRAEGEFHRADGGDSGGWAGGDICVGNPSAISVELAEGSVGGLSEVVDVHDGVGVLWVVVRNSTYVLGGQEEK